ncbi:hypothetical protein HPP92_008635 [Vanilla planifolia]|uniref:Bidirectional sugar transporter SWEET n=1 Tax=Vanilla planifolia TaxID=51239 RepID=A0A835REE1_VANPL|nr:hypothetical protein HPP92_008635 [Vanilla planifolia]
MVSSDQFRFAVGIIGNAISLSLFLSPVPTFIRICKNKSVEQFSQIPYIATLLNCMLWMLYGLPIVKTNNILVLTINTAGTAIELTYVFIYIIYSNGPKRLHTILLLLADIAFVGLVATLVLSLFPTHDKRTLVIGIVCVIFCIMMYAAPLSVMKTVIKTKSVEYMPLFLSLASFCNGLCWTVYSLLRFDINILIPNGIGLVFSVTQLVMHVMYYKSTKRQLAERKQANVALASNVAKEDSSNQV